MVLTRLFWCGLIRTDSFTWIKKVYLNYLVIKFNFSLWLSAVIKLTNL